MCKSQTNLGQWYIESSSKHFPGINAKGPHWQEVNTGSGDDLVPSGNKPLLETMLLFIFDAMCHH